MSKKIKKQWSEKSAEQKIESFAYMIDKAILSYPSLMKRSFMAGIFTGLGATLGVAIVLILLSAIVNWLGFIPFVGEAIQNGANQVLDGTKRK